MFMRILAGILGIGFIVVPIVAIVMDNFKIMLVFGFVLGPAFLLYAFGGQKLLERFFPQFSEKYRKRR